MKNKTLEIIGAWSGLAYVLLFGLGWVMLAHWLPPISPAASAAEVAAIYQERRIPLMLASIAMMVSVLPLLPFTATLLLVIQRIEGRIGVLTLTLAFSSILGMVLSFYTPFSFAVAAFRPERSPELVQLMSDFGLMQFMGGIPMFIMGWVVTAYAALVASPRENPILPRWFGYLNLWIAILYIPELLIFLFKTGPFAWDGVIGFWIPAILFTVYWWVTPFVLVRAVKRHL